VTPPVELLHDIHAANRRFSLLLPYSQQTMGEPLPQVSPLLALPMELLLRIRTQVEQTAGDSRMLTDPASQLLRDDRDGSRQQVRRLRLVCKMFDAILSPVVLTHICLFPRRNTRNEPNSFAEQIQSLLLGKHDLSIYTTLTLFPENWKCSDKAISSSSSRNVRHNL
jgi:hypothetical protein